MLFWFVVTILENFNMWCDDKCCYCLFLTCYILCRKQELRELKMLQKQEQKQFQDLSCKSQFNKESQVQ